MDPFIGEIRPFAGNYAPVDWALCDGTLYRISDNQVLYSLIGTLYGGDGVNTFAVPNLCGRVPVGTGQGAGMTMRVLGQYGGSEAVTLMSAQVPPHTHSLNATTAPASATSPQGALFGAVAEGSLFYVDGSKPSTGTATYSPSSISIVGGNLSHENRMPTGVVNYIISLFGIYPQPA